MCIYITMNIYIYIHVHMFLCVHINQFDDLTAYCKEFPLLRINIYSQHKISSWEYDSPIGVYNINLFQLTKSLN